MSDLVIHENDLKEKMILFTLFLLSAMLMFFVVSGIYYSFFGVPRKNAEIKELSQRIKILKIHESQLQKKIEQQRLAFRFENLFMLAADQNDLLDFSELEEYLCEKRGLCK